MTNITNLKLRDHKLKGVKIQTHNLKKATFSKNDLISFTCTFTHTMYIKPLVHVILPQGRVNLPAQVGYYF